MESPSLVLLSRQDALERQMAMVANNIANMGTTGFKQERMVFRDFFNPLQQGEKIHFVLDRATYRDTTQGPIVQTGNPLDVALEGDAYFTVQTPQGNRYTRGGSFTLNEQGEIINASGAKLLSADGQPLLIPVDSGSIEISPTGMVSTDKGQVGQIGLASFTREQDMTGDGDGLYQTGEVPQQSTATKVVQGGLERANVQPVVEMTQMIEVNRAYQQTQRLLDQENERMRNAIRVLSKVSA